MRPFSTQIFAGGGGCRLEAIDDGLLTNDGIADFTSDGELGADSVQLANREPPVVVVVAEVLLPPYLN
jgi:hypothetical protein